jgi:hypothetical protein
MPTAMAEIINLRLARKARDRVGKQAEAAANRALHGQTKAERASRAQEARRLAAKVDGARLEPTTPQPQPRPEPD